jgi:hypothetical protein
MIFMIKDQQKPKVLCGGVFFFNLKFLYSSKNQSRTNLGRKKSRGRKRELQENLGGILIFVGEKS